MLWPNGSTDGSMVMFVIWIWLLFVVFSDIFRSHDISGWTKALWVLGVIIFPYIGVLVYLIARGSKMQERAATQAQNQRQAFDAYVRQEAEKGSSVDQLAKLADLKSKGVLTDTEFETEKAKILA
jgi:hypothetical protein